jgi:hypothetical protein
MIPQKSQKQTSDVVLAAVAVSLAIVFHALLLIGWTEYRISTTAAAIRETVRESQTQIDKALKR